MSMMVSPYSFGPPPVALTWNPADYDSSRLALSNGNRTLTRNSASSGAYSYARGLYSKSAGKLYFEIALNTMISTSASVAGLALSTALLFSTSVNNAGANSCFVLGTTGEFWTNNATSVTPIAACTSGDVICVAVDLALQKVWFRKNGLAWNTGVGGTQDPASGQGGISLPVSTGWGVGNPIFPYGGIRYNPTVGIQTLNGDTSQMAQAIPSGFSAFGI